MIVPSQPDSNLNNINNNKIYRINKYLKYLKIKMNAKIFPKVSNSMNKFKKEE